MKEDLILIEEKHPLIHNNGHGMRINRNYCFIPEYQQHAFLSCIHAMQAMGTAGERAAAISKGNGSMMINFLDELCNLKSDE